ncbi:MAG: hypothetical protein FD165_1763 [Gammaproteobacteria bacterium]|nr:MAG: hypothetical protein FD165_1763 [Gammaproteobacteria bacterium]TND04335.1 MAG: hypothetical protein FD120_1449 [Gammaproteobacteria bacterium]
MATRSNFRTFRILFLLLILLFVALSTWLAKARSTAWDRPLWVVVYPVNGDGSEASARYISELRAEVFEPIEEFMAREARRHGLALAKPVTMKLAPPVAVLPPKPPPNGDTLGVMAWSLKMRYWGWKNDTFKGPSADIQMFVVYHDSKQYDRLAHSFGLQKGLLGVVNAFADRRLEGQNNVVIAHELLHTVGATDKYDLGTNLPIHPAGYAEPDKQPLYPQMRAEIMGGRIPISQSEAEIPKGLNQTLIGDPTGIEIRWLK